MAGRALGLTSCVRGWEFSHDVAISRRCMPVVPTRGGVASVSAEGALDGTCRAFPRRGMLRLLRQAYRGDSCRLHSGLCAVVLK